MSLNRDQIIEILSHYADPIIEHQDGSCGQCERAAIEKKIAEEELGKEEPSYYAFVKRSQDSWKETKHYKAWQEISKTVSKELEKNERIEIITQKMREMGLEP